MNKLLISLNVIFIIILVIILNYKSNFSNQNKSNKKNLIFTSAGDNTNFYNNWNGNNNNYDIMVVYYGDNNDTFNKYKNFSNYCYKNKGSKFQNFSYVWKKYKNILDSYERFFILDDDIIFDNYKDINLMFNISEKYNLYICAPTFKTDGSSKISHNITKSLNKNVFRYVNFIEVNTPLFNKYAITKYMEYYDDSLIGWGIDYHYIWALGKDLNDKYALVDKITVINPHDNIKNNKRELSLINDWDKRVIPWDKIKKKFNIKEWGHKTYNTVKLIKIAF
jgi:hypothetical protein